MTQEALKQLNLALETMEAACKRIDELVAENKALKEALAQSEQEPIAFYNPQQGGFYWAKPTTISCPQTVDVTPLALYTHSQRTWVGLTDEEIGDEYVRFEVSKGGFNRFEYAVRAIEAKLKERNFA
jgi:hypothetical protein